MKTPEKKKKSKENKQLKDALCDISKGLDRLLQTDKKLEELADYCCNEKRLEPEANQ